MQQRKQAVFGVGSESGPWLFVGEGPGADEDEQGEPFVGQAGKLLDAMLAAAGLQRGRDVYIANVVKCRPPGNRTPTPEEAAACAPYLDRQIELIRPRSSWRSARRPRCACSARRRASRSLRGRVHRYRGIPLVVTYHPAYLLRTPAREGQGVGGPAVRAPHAGRGGLKSAAGRPHHSRWLHRLLPGEGKPCASYCGPCPLLAALTLSGCGYNDFQTKDEQVKAAWSEVLNQYKRRADLIPNLVATVQGYAAQEKDVLLGVTQARAKVGSVQLTPEALNDPQAMQKFQAAQGELSERARRGCWWSRRTIRS